MKPRHHGWRHGPRSRIWWLAQGVHRRLRGIMGIALLGGVAAGIAIHAAYAAGTHPGGLVCAAAAVWLAALPLTWMATWMVLAPLRRLADVAGDLHGGHLERRVDLPEGRDEVGEVSVALRGMADRVARQLADQRALMAAVSHELRSPLGRVRVLVEMAREGSAPPTFHDDLDAEITALDGLVGDLLAAARIDFDAVSRRPLDAADVARRALDIAAVPATLVQEGAPGTVVADATLLARAVAGLLDNARRHGGPTIVLRIRDLDDRVRFEVDDDGAGFAAGDEDRAFEPFWRGPGRDGAPPSGTGLGLALVRQIATAHGGTAGALNLAGGGARVWLEVAR